MNPNSTLIRKWFDEVWNQGREQTIDEMCSPDAVGFGQAEHGIPMKGPEHFKQFWRGFRAAFSEIHLEVEDSFEEGDKVLARWTLSMKHTGTFQGIAPTSKAVSIRGMSMQRFAGGKIVEAWDNWDQLGLLVQLGVIPQPKFV